VTREQIFYEDVHPGDTLPALTVSADERQLFFFSAATYNGHRIHYDKDWARSDEGYDDVIVQGPLQAALLARAVTDWIGGRGRLVEYAVQNRAIALAGEQLTFDGSVTAKRLVANIGMVDLDIAGRRDDTVLMPGTATVALPLRGDRS
jgi:hydroxyacyl-ACP dehydratase HTD2-like protein with hotdog domain